MRLVRLFLGLTLVAWGQFSFAENYYWRIVGANTAININYSSADSACSAWANYWGRTYTGKTATTPTVGGATAAFTCKATNASSQQFTATINRLGASCPSGLVYDEVKGECVTPPNPCDSKKFQSGELVTDSLALELCDGQCTFAVEHVDSYMPNGKLTLLAKGKWTGEQCTTNQITTDLDPQNLPPLAETKVENKCEEPTTDGEGRKVEKCKFTKEVVDAQACVMSGGKLGTVNDVIKCVQGGKGPKFNKEVTDTESKEKTNVDGSKNKETKTTKTETKCVGDKACSTTSTNITKNESTKADGTPGDSSENCSGSGCTGDDGEGEEGQEEGEAPSYSVGALDKPTKLGTSNFGLDDWDNKIDQVKGDIEDARESLSGVFNGATNVSLGGGGGELPCTTFNFRGQTHEMCIKNFESQLLQIGNAIFLCACLIAAFIVFAPRGSN